MIKNPRYVYSVGKLKVPVSLNFGEYMIKKFIKWNDKTAIVNAATNERMSYNQIAQDAMNLAVSLRNLGLRRKDITALCSENQNHFLSAVVGCACTGGALAAINVGYSKDEFKHTMNISKPKYLICSNTAYQNYEKTIKELPYVEKIIVFGNEKFNNTLSYNELIRPNNNYGLAKDVNITEFEAVDVEGQNDTLLILYSSGTTGLPKGVMLTHLNVLTACCSKYDIENGGPPKEEPVAMTVGPWFHVMGLMSTLRYMAWGWTSVYIDKFHMKSFLDTIVEHKVSKLIVAPTTLIGVCKSDLEHDLSCVRQIITGAAPIRKDTLIEVKKKFPKINRTLQGYGLTETTFTVTREKDDYNISKYGSVGSLVMSSVAKVVNLETGEPLGPYEQGEICVKGPLVMKGYIGKDKREDFDDEGFFKTGDVGYYDNDDYFFVVGRVKEVIKYKGFQVAPAEIEAVLLQHDAIKDAGVIGIDHSVAGEVPMAFVVLQPDKDVTEKELQHYVAKRLSNPKHLRGGVKFVREIPRNVSGKILRRILRSMASNN